MLAGVAARTSIAKYLEAAGRAREGSAPLIRHLTSPFHQRQPNHQKAPSEAHPFVHDLERSLVCAKGQVSREEIENNFVRKFLLVTYLSIYTVKV